MEGGLQTLALDVNLNVRRSIERDIKVGATGELLVALSFFVIFLLT